MLKPVRLTLWVRDKEGMLLLQVSQQSQAPPSASESHGGAISRRWMCLLKISAAASHLHTGLSGYFLTLSWGIGFFSCKGEIPSLAGIHPVRPSPLNPGGWFSGQYILLGFEVLSRLSYVSLLVSKRRKMRSGMSITSAVNNCYGKDVPSASGVYGLHLSCLRRAVCQCFFLIMRGGFPSGCLQRSWICTYKPSWARDSQLWFLAESPEAAPFPSSPVTQNEICKVFHTQEMGHVQLPSEGRMQFRRHRLTRLSIILSIIEKLFGIRYNLMQSQVFCAFHSLFSPAFLHAGFGEKPVHGPRGLPEPPGCCKYSCLQLGMGSFQSLSHTLLSSQFYSSFTGACPGLVLFHSIWITRHQQTWQAAVSCEQVLRQLRVRCKGGENLADTRNRATSTVFSE